MIVTLDITCKHDRISRSAAMLAGFVLETRQ